MIVKLLTAKHLEVLSLIGGCIGSSESTLVKMSHCCKSHVVVRFSKTKETLWDDKPMCKLELMTPIK